MHVGQAHRSNRNKGNGPRPLRRYCRTADRLMLRAGNAVLLRIRHRPASRRGRWATPAEELAAVPDGANLGLGCGNPQAIAAMKPGEVVVDLGSGAGFDCLLAARQVGAAGRVIGVDMTHEMLQEGARQRRARSVQPMSNFVSARSNICRSPTTLPT